MKRRNLCAMTTVALTMLLTPIMTACGQKEVNVSLTDKALAGETIVDFANGVDSSVLFESDGWTNGDVFNVVWTKGNVKYEDGLMKLGITEEEKKAWLNDEEVTFNYTAGEARTQNYYGYGDYEVKMKPSANPGTASTFFVCTGNYDEKYVLDESGNVVYNEDGTIKTEQNPHDEIDIEFLGKDTTKVQFNFFVNGVGGNEYMYDLGFDAAKEYHEYGFRWTEDSITWFVDDKPVYKVTTDKNATAGENLKIVEKLPSTPGRMLANYWCGTEKAENWMGKYSGNTKDAGCEYLWIQTSAEGKPLNPSLKPEGGNNDTPATDWESSAAINANFGSTDKYTVVNENTSANIKYSDIGGSSYLNVEMNITEAAKQMNALHLTLKNNAATEAQVRVNVIDAELLSSGAQNASTNQSATMNGTEVYTDLTWGGSFFTIPAGETVEAVVYFNGQVETLQLMIDSSRNDASTYAGDVTVDDIKFALIGELEIPVDPENPTEDTTQSENPSEDPTQDPTEEPTETPEKEYTFTAINKNMKIKKSVYVRDLPHKTGEKLGSLKTGTEVYVFGKCNETGWYKISYKDSIGYVSVGYVDENTAVEPENPPEEPVVPEKPVVPDTPVVPENPTSGDLTTSINGTEVTFGGNVEDGYIVNANDSKNTLNVTYSGIVGNCYKNIWADVSNIAGTKNKFTVKITNNGTKEVKVRIDIESQTQVNANTTACNQSSTQDGNSTYTDLEWGGSMFTVAPKATITAEVTYDASKKPTLVKIFVDSHTYDDEASHSGNITFSNMAFSGEYVPGQKPSTPDVDVTGNSSLTFTAEENSGYTVDKLGQAAESVNVAYSGTDNTYKPITAAVAELAAGNNTFSIKIKNNGAETVRVRVDVQGTTWVATGEGGQGTDACNVSCVGGGSWTDTNWGGSHLDVAAGEEVTLVITYNGEGAQGAVKNILVFVGSSAGTGANVNANVTLSEFKFTSVK